MMKRCILAVLCLLVVSLGIANIVGGTARNLVLDITSPENDARVSSPVLIEGPISGSILQDHYIWIIHNPVNSGKWYPDGSPDSVSGTWNQLVYLVDPPGTNYIIKAVLVDKETNEKYQNYLDEGLKTDYWPGFPEKTEIENTELLDSIHLIKSEV